MKKQKFILVIDPKTGMGMVLNIPGIDYLPASGSIVRILNRTALLHGKPVVLSSVIITNGPKPIVTPGEANLSDSPAPFRTAVSLTRSKAIAMPTDGMLAVMEVGSVVFIGTESNATHDTILRHEEAASS